MGDQELYKKYHRALEKAEALHMGKEGEKPDFAITKTKQIREGSHSRADATRVFAISTILVVLRRMLQDGRNVPWSQVGGTRGGSARAVYLGAASLFRAAEPTLEPMFVRPQPPSLLIYAAELMHLLMHQEPGTQPPPFQLRDDAARGIHQLELLPDAPQIPLDLQPQESEVLVTEYIQTLINLNLSLPPDPNAKHVPTTLSDAPEGDGIVLGWDKSLGPGRPMDDIAVSGARRPGSESSGGIIPVEVIRVLSQSLECLRWNAALKMYALGMDLTLVCEEGFKRATIGWTKRKEQGKLLIAADVMRHASK